MTVFRAQALEYLWRSRSDAATGSGSSRGNLGQSRMSVYSASQASLTHPFVHCVDVASTCLPGERSGRKGIERNFWEVGPAS